MNKDKTKKVPESILVVGGCGAVGKLLCTALQNEHSKLTVMDIETPDRALDGIEYIIGDITHSDTFREWQASDLIILSVPEEIAIQTADLANNYRTADTCFIDTLSVKSKISEHWKPVAKNAEVLSINPMFGPSLGFQDQCVAYLSINIGPISNWFLSAIENAGSQLAEFSAKDHDQYTAATQAATHAAILSFGMTLNKMSYDCEASRPLWTPPHKMMLAMLSRILSAAPEVYRDIQQSNPYAKSARKLMLESMRDFDQLISSNDAEQFELALKQVAACLDGNIDELSQTCSRTFKDLHKKNNNF